VSETRETPVLRAGHVVLRPHTWDDIDLMTRACQDPEIARWTMVPDPYDETHARAYLDRITGGAVDTEFPRWVICTADDNSYMGGMGLVARGVGSMKVGYFVAPWARDRGIATLALWAACDWAFREGECEVVHWDALPGNDRSRRVAEKVGFQIKTDVMRKWVEVRGQLTDSWLGDLFPEDLVPLKSLL
jgi:RimJ/RimL family protein N-acetyltransferase